MPVDRAERRRRMRRRETIRWARSLAIALAAAALVLLIAAANGWILCASRAYP